MSQDITQQHQTQKLARSNTKDSMTLSKEATKALRTICALRKSVASPEVKLKAEKAIFDHLCLKDVQAVALALDEESEVRRG